MIENKSIAILGWVTIARKQKYQIKSLLDQGYVVHIFTNDLFSDSKENIPDFPEKIFLRKLRKTFMARIAQVLSFFFTTKNLKLAIIAPVGRFSIFYFIFCWLFRVRIVCVEWGDIQNLEKLGRLVVFNTKMLYKYSEIVWFKEPHMEPLLHQYKAKKTYFLPNAVETSENKKACNPKRDLSFVWANRLIRGRYPEWMAQAFLELNAKGRVVNGVMVGFLQDERADLQAIEIENRIKKIKPPNMSLLDFREPFEFFQRARYFVLAADYVFGNNSLLEAMSNGVVPVVTDAPGVELIVRDGWNGIVTPLSYEGFLSGMWRAINLSEQEWKTMSENALATVNNEFSVGTWANGMKSLVATVCKD